MNDLLSEIRMFAFPSSVKDWIPCDGRALAINQNLALFSLIGTTYGGNESVFNVPDLRERVTIGNGGVFPDFARGGEAKHTLTTQEMPRHRHQAVASSNGANSPTPRNHYWPSDAGYVLQSNAVMSDQAIDQVGYGGAHENMSPYETVNYCICVSGMMPSGPAEDFLGTIKVLAGKVGSRDWVPCDGRLLAVDQNEALFSLIRFTYGGNGTTQFAVPDLRGRAPVCWGKPKDLTPYQPGDKAGEVSVKLTVAQMPSHYHPALANVNGNSQQPDGHVWANEDRRPQVNDFASEIGNKVLMNPNAIGEEGGDESHNNMMPYQGIEFWIMTSGIYPSRP